MRMKQIKRGEQYKKQTKINYLQLERRLMGLNEKESEDDQRFLGGGSSRLVKG